MKQDMEEKIHERLVKQYEKYYRLAYSYVQNEADALDVVQEGAYKAILKCDSLKREEYMDTWIYRIMVNEALSLIRRRKQNAGPVEALEEGREDRYEDMDLKDAIEQLEPIDKTIIVLRFFEDFKIEQIAEIVNENRNTVKSRLYRTLKKLRLSLED